MAGTPQRNDAPPRVGVISLGCAKNLVDAEVMLGSLMADGLEITNEPAEADALIVNTCSFIESAQEESVDTILESAELRQAHRPGQALIVSGCLPQRFCEELPKLIPEVDAFMGVDQVAEVPRIVREAITRRAEKPPVKTTAKARTKKKAAPAPVSEINHRPQYVPDVDTPRFRLTPRHTAYVKIAEGCNHPCSFCVIPQMRGRHRSRTIASVVAEARQLVAQGVKELNLISQDTTYFGMDLWEQKAGPRQPVDSSRGPTLCRLLQELDQIEGDFWIRLLYTHPAHWSDELIATIAQSERVARYVDMPLQHIHEEMLQLMRRETSREHIEDLIVRLREGIPGLAIRTTFITGFPGETDEHFESLLEFIERVRFERLGVFKYSQEEGSRAAKMDGQIPASAKNKRHARAMKLQQKIARELAEAQRGRRIKVLVEQPQVARSEHDAPDVDCRVLLESALPVGRFAEVQVTGAQVYDIVARPCNL